MKKIEMTTAEYVSDMCQAYMDGMKAMRDAVVAISDMTTKQSLLDAFEKRFQEYVLKREKTSEPV